MNKNFGGIIWTNHALQKLSERGIKQGDAWATWRNPEQSRKARIPGAWVYYRTYPSAGSGQAQKIEVVAKKNEKGEWIILSVWSRPVYGREKKAEPFIIFLIRKVYSKICSSFLRDKN
jgi:hypothetical protein